MGNCQECFQGTDTQKGKVKIVPLNASKQQGVAEMQQNYKFETNMPILSTSSYSRVFLTHSLFNPDQQVVIKAIDKEKLQQDQNIENVLEQLSVLRTLDHKGVVKFLETYNDKQNIYLVMEKIEGQYINKWFEIKKKKHLKDKDWFEKKLIKLFLELFQAIAHIHSQGVIHLDLRPENIIITKDKIVKLIGFGIRKQSSKKIKGIQTYLAPEITEGNSFDSKVDIWSIGVIMYNLMTDRVPFIIKSQKGKESQPISVSCDFTGTKVSYYAQSICKDMLQMDPEIRPTAKKLLGDPWFKMFDAVVEEQEEIIKKKQQATEVIYRLKQFKGGSQFKRAAIIFLVKISTQSELGQASLVFDQIDFDRTGIIDASELKHYIQKFKLGLTDMQILNMIMELDYNGDGQINYTEFLAATIDQEKLMTDEKLRSVFSVFDTESKGAVSADNMRFAFEKLGIHMEVEEAQKIMAFHGLKPKQNMNFELFKEIILPNKRDILMPLPSFQEVATANNSEPEL